jgi:hypothetical protein
MGQILNYIKMVHGISDITYGGSMSTKPLYGPGQGGAYGPPFWNLLYIQLLVGSSTLSLPYHIMSMHHGLSIF